MSRVHDALAGHVADGSLPGAVAIVSRGGALHVDAIGLARDTLFRISSMTKPMAAAVAMVLVEDGTLELDTPVDRWLPELADRRVLARLDGPLDETVPAKRAITVRDLLAFRMGFGIVWGPQDALPIQRAAHALRLGAFGPPRPQEPPAPDEWMRRFATLPLMEQPGERWRYNTSAEVLGVLLARASGRPLDALMKERLFAPLGMKDTGFFVPPEHVKRLATSYSANPAGGLDVFDEAEGGAWARAPAFPSAGAGLVSTADDCLAFARTMSGGGALDGARVLATSSVVAMTKDTIACAEKDAPHPSLDGSFLDSFGWGLGLAIVRKRGADGPFGFGWDGGLGTSMWWDPREDAIAILMTQRSAYPKTNPVYRDFWRAVNAG